MPESTLKASLDQIAGLPVTIEHPPGLLDPQNIKAYIVGVTKEAKWDADKEAIWVKLILYTEEAHEALEDKQGLSPGYLANVVPGAPDGVDATHTQKERRYNHIAITAAGRGGEEMALQVDSEGLIANFDAADGGKDEEEQEDEKDEKHDEEDEQEEEQEDEKEEQEDEEPTLDGVMETVDALRAQVDELKSTVDAMNEGEQTDSVPVHKQMQEYVGAVNTARMLGVQFDSEDDAAQIKRKVVQERAKRDVSNERQGYIDERYRAIVDMNPQADSVAHLSAAFGGSPSDDSLNPAEALGDLPAPTNPFDSPKGDK